MSSQLTQGLLVLLVWPSRVCFLFPIAAGSFQKSRLVDQFNENVRDSTRQFELVLSADEIAGLPSSILEAAAKSYSLKHPGRAPQMEANAGPWRLTLESELVDIVSKFNPLRYLKSRELREQLYKAFSTRASSGRYDNRRIIGDILRIRRREAETRGFKTFSDWMTTRQMLGSVAQIYSLLATLSEGLQPIVQQELKLLHNFALSSGHEGVLQPWDLDYWEERFRKDRLSYDEEELRSYLSLPKVLDSMLQLGSKLFSITIDRGVVKRPPLEVDAQAMLFTVSDSTTGEHIGSFYLNPHGDEENTQTLVKRSVRLGRKPVEIISLALPRPTGGEPCLLRLKNVESLFHEFGHVLATMFTDRFEFSKVERDNMEIMSFFMECWMYHKPTFDSFAVHYITGESLSHAAFEHVLQSASLGSARALLWYVARAALDLELHARYDAVSASESLQDVERRVMTNLTAEQHHLSDCWVCIFDHVFDGDEYASNEYSYLWGQVLAFDAYEAFSDAGLDNTSALSVVGRHFRETVLAPETSQPLMEVYHNFRGQHPSVRALLKHKALHPTMAGLLSVCET